MDFLLFSIALYNFLIGTKHRIYVVSETEQEQVLENIIDSMELSPCLA